MDIFYFSRNRIQHIPDLYPFKLPYMDLTIVISGSAQYTFNNETVDVKAGDAILFQPGDFRVRSAGGLCEYYSFNALLDGTENLPWFNGVIRKCITPQVLSLLKLFEEARDSLSERHQEKCECYFKALYYSINESFERNKHNPVIEQIKKFIDSNIHRQITVTEISKLVFLSPNYCNSFFKKQTGMTLTEYIISRKMKKAKQLLISTDKSLTEISTAVGYDNYSYFSRTFKKVTGYTPVKFRQKTLYEIPSTANDT